MTPAVGLSEYKEEDDRVETAVETGLYPLGHFWSWIIKIFFNLIYCLIDYYDIYELIFTWHSEYKQVDSFNNNLAQYLPGHESYSEYKYDKQSFNFIVFDANAMIMIFENLIS